MNLNLLFLLANGVACVAWLVLLAGVLRRRQLTGAARAIGTLLALAYLVLFVLNAEAASVLIRDYSIAGVQSFFAHPALALVGWVHYLAFDLWVGAWEVDTAPPTMPRTLLVAVMLLTFLVGPIGLCTFLVARRRWM